MLASYQQINYEQIAVSKELKFQRKFQEQIKEFETKRKNLVASISKQKLRDIDHLDTDLEQLGSASLG